jgi:hypothetical protein
VNVGDRHQVGERADRLWLACRIRRSSMSPGARGLTELETPYGRNHLVEALGAAPKISVDRLRGEAFECPSSDF